MTKKKKGITVTFNSSSLIRIAAVAALAVIIAWLAVKGL